MLIEILNSHRVPVTVIAASKRVRAKKCQETLTFIRVDVSVHCFHSIEMVMRASSHDPFTRYYIKTSKRVECAWAPCNPSKEVRQIE